MISERDIRAMSRLGQRGSFFGKGLIEVADKKESLYVVTADVCRLSGLERYQKKYPENLVNVGIAEQQMIGLSTGLALEGGIVYATTYGAFTTERGYEQIRTNVSALKLNVKLIGTGSGYSLEGLGYSHWSTEDISITRCLPNFTVISPADSFEAYKACLAISELAGPVYVRLYDSRDKVQIYTEDYEYKIGKGIVLRQGADAVVFTHGRMTQIALQTYELLLSKGISCEVVNLHTIKPIDNELVIEELNSHKIAVSVEDHNIIGGLGSAIAEVIADNNINTRLKRYGMEDRFYNPGSEHYIFEQMGVTPDILAKKILQELERNDYD